MLVVGEHAGSHIAGFSNQFQSEFVSLLSRRRVHLQFCFLLLFSPLLICIIVLIYIYMYRFGTKRVRANGANQVYQEYIADKSHLHMNSTRWVTLTEFVKHLGRSGIAKVDETERGWFIAWIDSSPKALAKAVRLLFLFFLSFTSACSLTIS